MWKSLIAAALLILGWLTPALAAVAIDLDCSGFNQMPTSGVGATNYSYIASAHNFVSGVSNSAVVVTIIQLDGASVISAPGIVWDTSALGSNTSMTLINHATNGNQSIWFFGLRNPSKNPTTQSMTITWTNAAQITPCSTSFSGVDQTSDAAAFKNFNSATNGTPISVGITAAAGDMQVAAFSSPVNFTSTNNTLQNIQNTGNSFASAANLASGSGTVTMTGNPGNASSLGAGIDIGQSGGGAPTAAPLMPLLGVGP
jgi:hypothetical protein